MIANLISKSDGYHCSNCMMRQSGIPIQCFFCGETFGNWYSVTYKEIIEKEKRELEKLREDEENESNVY